MIYPKACQSLQGILLIRLARRLHSTYGDDLEVAAMGTLLHSKAILRPCGQTKVKNMSWFNFSTNQRLEGVSINPIDGTSDHHIRLSRTRHSDYADDLEVSAMGKIPNTFRNISQRSHSLLVMRF